MGFKASFKKHFFFNLNDVENLNYEEHLVLFHYLLKLLGNDWISKTGPNRIELAIGLKTTLLLTYMFISELHFIKNNLNDLSKVTECMMTLFLGIAMYIKFLILMFYRQEIKNLIVEMSKVFDEAKFEGGERWKIMLKYMKEGRIITRVLYFFMIFVALCFLGISLLQIKKFRMILPAGLLGFPTGELSGYMINMTVQIWALMLATNNLSGFGCIWIYFILTLCAQTEILNLKLLSLGNKKKSIKNDSEGIEKGDVDDDDDYWEFDYNEMEKRLDECFKLHQWMFRISDAMNSIYKIDCLSEIVLSTMVGCVSLYQIAESINSESDVPMQFYAYFVACILQIFVYCWYGDLIMHKSVSVCDAIYLSSWYKSNYRQQRMLYLMLYKSQKPIIMSGIFFDVCLSSFTQVMKTTYSFYAVLSTSSEN